MGIYSEYLDRKFTDFDDLSRERKLQLQRISTIRGRDVLVIGANLHNPGRAPIGIAPADILPISDQLGNLHGNAVDVILETPGGSGEAAEDIVRLIRGRYESMAVIIPGTAKSAGTIIAMAGDEILMDASSALGPIDAQIMWQGKVFSADALLQGMNRIKDEVVRTNSLNRAYVPMLQNISPGELQHAQNALDFAQELVRDWLARYKFKDWATHTSTGASVTDDEKRERAAQIAAQLCDHGRWKTHGRSIHLDDLHAMRLRVTDFSQQPDLADAIRRYFVLLRMTFESTVYKLFETPTSQILKLQTPEGGVSEPEGIRGLGTPKVVEVGMTCKQCKTESRIQANFAEGIPLKAGRIPFPGNNKVQCPGCGTEHDLTLLRRQLEAQAKGRVITPMAPAEGGQIGPIQV